MKIHRHIILSILATTFTITASGSRGTEPTRKADSIIDSVRTVYPSAADIKPLNTIWNSIIDKKGNQVGFLFNSQEYGTDIWGYYEDVPTIVVTDKSHKIVKVAVVNSLETPSYLNKIYRSGFLKKWNGIDIKEASKTNVDAVTGATLTSEAVIENIKLISDKSIANPVK
ncbi:MAG: FMN-binding protein [Bacteroidales bacterium]